MTTTGATQQSISISVGEALRQAISQHQAGQLKDAEILYRAILRTWPNHPDANHNLGVMLLQSNRSVAGLTHLWSALEANPAHDQYWLSYIDALIKAHKFDEARQVLSKGRQRELPTESVRTLEVRLEETEKQSLNLAMTVSPDQQLKAELVTLISERRYSEASVLAQETTRRFPLDGFGWKVLGAALTLMGRNSDAIEAMHRAVALSPTDAESHKNLGATLQKLGKFEDAISCYRRSLVINPADANAHNNLGKALSDFGLLDDAMASYRRALEIEPNHARAHNNMGNALNALGKIDDAEKSYRKALAINVDYAEAHNNLGSVLTKHNKIDDAVASYRRALAINPSLSEVHNNLASALMELGKLDQAAASYRQAIAINPNYASAHNNLGAVFKELGMLKEAVASYQRALDIKPDLAEAHSNIGDVLQELGRLDEAVTCYCKALITRPDNARTHNGLGQTLQDIGNINDAVKSFQRAMEISPLSVQPRVMLTLATLSVIPNSEIEATAATDEFDRALKALEEWLYSLKEKPADFYTGFYSKTPFYLAYRKGNQRERLSRFGDLLVDCNREINNFQIPLSSTQRRLRLLVVSSHFRSHSVWNIVTSGLLRHLDKQKFELVLYHTGITEDSETMVAKSLAEVWRDTNTTGLLGGWHRAVMADCPDIILYPELGMDPISLQLASCRLAPLQTAGWGHPITTGLPTIDIFFSGELLEPLEPNTHYREQLVRLPGTGCCTTPGKTVPRDRAELNQELAIRSGTRFVIAQTPFKFDPADDVLYARIAANVGDCTFILFRYPKLPWATDRVISRLSEAFRRHGLVPERHLMLIPWLSSGNFCSLLDQCDVYLDCPSFSGYTTAWQAVHCGLPVVTLEGQYMRQRLAAGLLRRIGMTETIATTADEYVSIASQLAKESRDRQHYDTRRQAIKAAAPLADNDISVVRAFEKTLIDAFASKLSQLSEELTLN